MRRDAVILAGLFIALVAVIALGPARSANSPGTSASSYASGPQGALALYRWLEAMGYQVSRIQHEAFAPDPAAQLLIVLGPSERYSREDAAAVADWVAQGGVLLVAEDQTGPVGAASLLDAFGLSVAEDPEGGWWSVAPLQPILASPPVRELEANTGTRLVGERNDLALLAGSEQGPVLVGLQHGRGYVYASSALYPFSNAGLGAADNDAMVLNLLRRVPVGARVAFDEYHHGFITAPSLRRLLLETPWGWAILYACGVVAAYLLLTGRRLGRPVPLAAEVGRRSSAEYLESMAGLLRRAGKADYLRDHYRATLKRRLARAYGLRPDQDDEPFLEALAEASPGQAAAATAALAQLAQAGSDEQALLRAVAEADRAVEPR